mgnify:FL=1
MICLLSERLSVLYTFMFTREQAHIKLNRLQQTIVGLPVRVHVRMREHMNRREQNTKNTLTAQQ